MVKNKKKIWIRIGAALLIVTVLAYGIFQLISLFSREVEHSRLYWHTAEEKIESMAIFFRDETVITASGGSYD